MKRLKDGIGWALCLSLIALLASSFASPPADHKADGKVLVKAEQTAHIDVIDIQTLPTLELIIPVAELGANVDLVDDEQPAAVQAGYLSKLKETTKRCYGEYTLYNARSRDKPAT